MFNLLSLISTLFSIFLFFIQLILINQLIFLDHFYQYFYNFLYFISDFMIYYGYLLFAAISIMSSLLYTISFIFQFLMRLIFKIHIKTLCDIIRRCNRFELIIVERMIGLRIVFWYCNLSFYEFVRIYVGWRWLKN